MTVQSPPPNYYRDYFMQMVGVVEVRYADILSDEDQAFIDGLHRCTEPALRLLIRLYLRKGPNFLVDKLNYVEVDDVTSAIEELSTLTLIEKDPVVYAYELIELLPIAQSRAIFSTDPKCRKADLVDAWLDDDELRTCSDWGIPELIITPTNYDGLRRLQLLYFGNERQNLTDFILEDLGLFKYEQYRLDKSNRLFDSTADVEQVLALSDLAVDFYLMNDSKDWSTIHELAAMLTALTVPNNLQPKWHRLLNRVGYRLEQLGELESALNLLRTNDLPPSRERKVRIYFKLADFDSAWQLFTQITDHPLSADEQQFARRFVNKLRPKLGLPKVTLNKPAIREIHHEWRRGEGTVEEQAVRFFEGSVWLENHLPLAVFGLLYWPAIFADIPGVWHHPFQAGPTDLNDPEFSLRREPVLTDIAQQTKQQWRKKLLQIWQDKQGLRNPFVHWSVLTLDTVSQCFDALTKEQWQAIFDHILADVRHNRSGFPDLFQVTKSHYRFIEIKGPGDKLQDNQIAWLDVFNQNNINADVCYVRYTET